MITLAHSWEGLIGHIVRGTTVTRVQIKKCKLLDCKALAVDVTFFEKGKVKRKLVHPLTLYTSYLLWLSSDVVSDDDQEGCLDVVPALLTAFPVFTVDKSTLSTMDVTLVQWIEKQIASLKNLML